MELSSKYVGNRCKTLEIEVTRRWIMNYAAGTGDLNPLYFDDEGPGGLIAPPMLSVGLTWQISADANYYWAGQSLPREVGGRGVHYSEVIQWNRPMKPGETYRIHGEHKAILPHRSGTHVITEFRAVDAAGDTVFTEYSGGLLRGVTCTDEGRGAESVPAIPHYKETGTPLWEKPVKIDPLTAHIYDACANIHNPIHTSVDVAHKVGLPDIILHGTATLALAVREITNAEAGADPRRLKALRCHFTAMVLMDTEITIQVLGKQRRNGETDVHFAVLNPDGRNAIRNGCVTLAD